jgi:methyl halide transferase
MQHTLDWDERFRSGDTPWEDEAVAPVVVHLFDEYVPIGASVLDIGCGLGTTSLWLAHQGYTVTACDIAPEAVRRTSQRARHAGLSIDCVVADVLIDRARRPRPDVVFDRGVLHSFTKQPGREAFAAAVADLLDPGALWLDVSGSADTPGDPGEAARHGWPRLTLANIIAAGEPYFEVLSVRQTTYGTTRGRTDFLAFACVFRRR